MMHILSLVKLVHLPPRSTAECPPTNPPLIPNIVAQFIGVHQRTPPLDMLAAAFSVTVVKARRHHRHHQSYETRCFHCTTTPDLDLRILNLQ